MATQDGKPLPESGVDENKSPSVAAPVTVPAEANAFGVCATVGNSDDDCLAYRPIIPGGPMLGAPTFICRARISLEEFYERDRQRECLLFEQYRRNIDASHRVALVNNGRQLLCAAKQLGERSWLTDVWFEREQQITAHADLIAWCLLIQRWFEVRDSVCGGIWAGFHRPDGKTPVAIPELDLREYARKLPGRLKVAPEQVAVELSTFEFQLRPVLENNRPQSLELSFVQAYVRLAWKFMRMLPGGPWPIIPKTIPDTAAATRALDMVMNWCKTNGPPFEAAASAATTNASEAAHSIDFRSVHWFGTPYRFTGPQAACVKIWWEHWQQMTPDVSDAAVLEVAEVSSRLRALFQRHKAWGTMIVEGNTKGTHRLAEPPPK